MEYRLLGRTGVSVSPLCLGAMMFGPWGNDDRADAIRVVHRALDAGINFVDTADVYSGDVSEEIVGEALQGRRDEVVLATKFFMSMDDRPNHGGGSRKWIMQEAENSLRRLKTDYTDLYQVHRPSATTGYRGDPRCADRPRAPGQGPLHRLVLLPGQPDRRSAMGLPRAEPGPVRHRAAAVLDPGPRYRGGRAPNGAALRHENPRVQPAVRWLADRPVARAPRYADVGCTSGCPLRHEHPCEPAQAGCRVEELAQLAEKSGMTMIELALAWAINHPGVTLGDHRPADSWNNSSRSSHRCTSRWTPRSWIASTSS
jgi:hypothetical protein